MECCLKNICKAEHEMIPKPAFNKLWRIGFFMEGHAICAWCLLHLQDMVKPALVNDEEFRLEGLKKKFPGYQKVIEKYGLEKARRELNFDPTEAEPDGYPTRPEQRPDWVKNSVSVYGIGKKP
jgi:hypothetical protein